MNRKAFGSLVVLPLAIAGVSFADAPKVADPGIKQDYANVQKGVAPVRASKLVGMEVYDHQDKHLGEIKDVVLDRDGKRIGYAVLSYGGLLGMGDKLFAVPYKMLEYSTTNDSRVHIGLDEQTLRGAPGFDKNHWPDKVDATYYKDLDEYYSKHGKQVVKHDLKTEDLRHDQMAPKTEGLTWNRRLSSLLGANVENPAGENLGEVKEVIVDWDSGEVQYDVLSFGGILGMGDKLFAIPAGQFSSKADARELVLNISKDTLKQAPGFDQRNWPNFADRTWREQNDRAFMKARTGEATIDNPHD